MKNMIAFTLLMCIALHVGYSIYDHVNEKNGTPANAAQPRLSLHLPRGEWHVTPAKHAASEVGEGTIVGAYDAVPSNGRPQLTATVEAVRLPLVNGKTSYWIASTMKQRIYDPIRACSPLRAIARGGAWSFDYVAGPHVRPGGDEEFSRVVHAYSCTAIPDVYLHVTVTADDDPNLEWRMRAAASEIVARSRVE